MGHFKALHHVLFDQQEGNALPVDTLNQGKELLDEQGRKTEGRFVENKKYRFGHQAASNCQHLLLTARQTACALRLSLGETRENVEYPLAILPSLSARAPITPKIEIVLYAEVGKDAATFGNVNESTRDYARRPFPLNRIASEADRTFSGAQYAGDCAVESRFARAIGSEHGDDFAPIHSKVDAAQHLGFPVTGMQIANDEQWTGVHTTCPSFAAAP